MYLKLHYPTAFYTAQLQKLNPNDTDRVRRLLKDADRHGIKVKTPQLNRSKTNWSIDGDRSIIAGFVQVPGIGPRYADAIVAARKRAGTDEERDGPGDTAFVASSRFSRWSDLEMIKGIGPKKIQQIRAFAESNDPFGLEAVARTLSNMRAEIDSGEMPVPRPTHYSDGVMALGSDPRVVPGGSGVPVVWMGIVKKVEYKDAIEDERARHGTDIEEIKRTLKDPHLVKSATLMCYDDGDEEVYVRVNRWQFPRYKEEIASIAAGRDIIVVQGVRKAGFGANIHIRGITVIEPD